MTTEKTKLINTIADRIKTEREKHPFIDWEIFAAQKIYDTLITYWQEKTRWIPVEERLPEAREIPYFIAIKYKVAESDSDNIGAICIYDKTDVDYILLEGITHWKEIE